jgi:hypothetical protein
MFYDDDDFDDLEAQYNEYAGLETNTPEGKRRHNIRTHITGALNSIQGKAEYVKLIGNSLFVRTERGIEQLYIDFSGINEYVDAAAEKFIDKYLGEE